MSVTTWDAATTAAVRAELVNQLWDGYEPDSPEDAAELVQQLKGCKAWVDAVGDLELKDQDDAGWVVERYIRASAAAPAQSSLAPARPHRRADIRQYQPKLTRGSLQQLMTYREALPIACALRRELFGHDHPLSPEDAAAWLNSHHGPIKASEDVGMQWHVGMPASWGELSATPYLVIHGQARELVRGCQAPQPDGRPSLVDLCGGTLDAAVAFVLTGDWLRPNVTTAIHYGPNDVREITLRVLELEVTSAELAAIHQDVLQRLAKPAGLHAMYRDLFPEFAKQAFGRKHGRDTKAHTVALAMVALEVRHIEGLSRHSERRSRGAGFAAQVLRRWKRRAAALGCNPEQYRTAEHVQKVLDRMRKRAGETLFD